MNWDPWVMECLNLLSQQSLIESLLCPRQRRDPSPCLDGAGYPVGKNRRPYALSGGSGFLESNESSLGVSTFGGEWWKAFLQVTYGEKGWGNMKLWMLLRNEPRS